MFRTPIRNTKMIIYSRYRPYLRSKNGVEQYSGCDVMSHYHSCAAYIHYFTYTQLAYLSIIVLFVHIIHLLPCTYREEASPPKPNTTLGSVLKEHFSFILIHDDPDDTNTVIVRRNHILNDALRAISQSSFNCHKLVQVIFLGEEAVDEGGPRREFFSLALQAMAESHTLFQGPTDRRSFTHNVQAISTRKFFYAGMLVALSLANGGPGLPCLAEAVYNYFCYGLSARSHPVVEDIPDFEIQERMERVRFYSGHCPP